MTSRGAKIASISVISIRRMLYFDDMVSLIESGVSTGGLKQAATAPMLVPWALRHAFRAVGGGSHASTGFGLTVGCYC